MGGIIAGLEAGFVLPVAGGDVEWLEGELGGVSAAGGGWG